MARNVVRHAARSVPPPSAGTAAVLVPALVMLGLGLWGLDRGSMWRDEGVTFQVAQRTVPQIWQVLRHVDIVHAFYYLLLHVLLPFHPGEVMLRLPSVAAATVTAGVVGALGARLARPRLGLWAGLLYAVTPMVGHYAQEGGSYALVAAGVALATLLLVRAANSPYARVVDWYAYAAVVAVTALLHELSVLMLLAHVLTLAVSRAPRAVWRGFVCAVGAAVVVLLPLAYASKAQAGQLDWLLPPGAAEADLLVRSFAGPTRVVLLAQLTLVSVALRAPLDRQGRLSLNAVALPLVLVPPLVLFAVSQYRSLYDPRYVLFALAGAPLLVAAGGERLALAVGRLRSLGRPPRRATAALFGVGVVALGFWWQLPVHERERTPASRPDDLAAVARVTAREVRPGDAVLFLPAVGRRTQLVYPDSFRGTYDVALSKNAADTGTLYGREVGPEELRGRLVKLNRVWVLSERWVRYPSWYPKDPTEQAKLSVVDEEFVQRAEFKRSGVTLTLYERRPWRSPGDSDEMPSGGAAGPGSGTAPPLYGTGTDTPATGGYATEAPSSGGSQPYVPPSSRYVPGDPWGDDGYPTETPLTGGPGTGAPSTSGGYRTQAPSTSGGYGTQAPSTDGYGAEPAPATEQPPLGGADRESGQRP